MKACSRAGVLSPSHVHLEELYTMTQLDALKNTGTVVVSDSGDVSFPLSLVSLARRGR